MIQARLRYQRAVFLRDSGDETFGVAGATPTPDGPHRVHG